MRPGRAFRRFLMVGVIVGAAGFAWMNPGVVKAFYEDLYPSDPVKRQALDLCFMQDHKFNRLEADQREACYHRMLLPLGELAPPVVPADQPNVNIVDLQRAAGQGTLPRNDIRRIEQNQNPPRPPR